MSTRYTDTPHSYLYHEYACDNEYTVNPGTLVLPVAEDQPTATADLATWSPVVVIQAFAPSRHRTVRVAAQKDGAPPLLPAASTSGPFTFVGGAYYFHGPQINSGCSNHIWAARGELHFVENVAGTDSGFVLGNSCPYATQIDVSLRNKFGVTDANATGAVAASGSDVKAGFTEARRNVDLSKSSYAYYNTTYYPSQFFNTGMVSGDVFIPNAPTSTSTTQTSLAN